MALLAGIEEVRNLAARQVKVLFTQELSATPGLVVPELPDGACILDSGRCGGT